MKIKGYACHYNKVNRNGEIVDEKSFAEFLNQRRTTGIKTPINYNHNDDLIIGAVENFYSDKSGLFIVADIYEDIDIVKKQVLPLINNGVIDRFSTEGFILREDIKRIDKNTYYAKNFDLTAVAVVNNPADLEAKFSTNKFNQNVTFFNAFPTIEQTIDNQIKTNRFYKIL